MVRAMMWALGFLFVASLALSLETCSARPSRPASRWSRPSDCCWPCWPARHPGPARLSRCGYGVTCSGVGVKAVALETKEYLHCIVTKTARYHVRCSTGAAIVTPVDYELFL